MRQYEEAKASRKMQWEAGEIRSSIASFFFGFVTTIIITFFLSAMVKMVYEVPEYVLSLEENVKVSSSTTTTIFSVKQREAVTMDLEVFITFTLTTLTKMSLIIVGIEVNPGPTTMFLLDVPHEVETRNTPLTLVCNDGTLVGDITILSKYSNLFNDLVEPN